VRVKNAIALVGAFTMLVVLPLAINLMAFAIVVHNERYGSDFSTFYDSGRAVLHGASPYPALASLPHVAGPLFAPFVYPPVAAFSMIPLSVLPFPVAVVLFCLINLAAAWLALRLLGVSDWRCYSIVYASSMMYAAVGIGTISPLLFLGVAAAWRFRHRAVIAGLLVAYVITAKLFLWPLWIWLVCTRRFKAAAVAAIAAGSAVLASWSLIGFAGMREYPRLLGRLTELEGPHSYSLYSLGRSLGLASAPAQSVVYVATIVAVAAAFRFVRGDRQWLVAALGLSLLATPILWPHYLVLLWVPVALTHRRFSLLWLAPLALWLDAAGWSWGNPLRIIGLLAFVAAIVAVGLGTRLHLQQGRAELSARPAPSLP
jgi:glycosyl transferase family 87